MKIYKLIELIDIDKILLIQSVGLDQMFFYFILPEFGKLII